MGKAGAVRAGQAFIELFADDTALVRGLRRAQQRLQTFGAGVRSIGQQMVLAGGAAAAGFGAAVGVFVSVGDQLDKMSQRTGIAVESLSELRFAAEQSGADMETLEKGIRTAQRTITDASRGLKSAKEALGELGLTAEQLMKLSPEEQFKLIADRLSQVKDATTRAALAMQILGRAGTQLLPLMLDGAAGIEALQAEARRLGLTISTQTAKDAARLGDAIDALKSVLRATVVVIGAAVAPAVERVTKHVTRAAVAVSEWVKSNRNLVVTVVGIVVGVTAVGSALVALGIAVTLGGVALGGIATVITTVGAVLSGLIVTIGAALSPLGALAVSLAAATVAFFRYSTAGQAAIDFLAMRFGELSGYVRKTIDGIRLALSNGQISLAARVLWAGLKVVWLEGTKEIRETFAGGLFWMRKTLLTVTIAMQRLWISFSSGIRTAWEKTQGWLAKRFLELQGLFDDSLDVDAAKEVIEGQARAGLDRIAKEAEDALRNLDQEQTSREQRLLDDSMDRMEDRRKALEDAKKELDSAVEEARLSRDQSEGLGKTPSLRDRFGELEDLDISRKVEARGTFSAAAVQGLASGGAVAERTAKASEETARNTRRMAERANTGGLTFT